MWGSIVGGALSLGSSLLNKSGDRKKAKQAAAQIQPWNIDTDFGGAEFDQKNRSVTANLSPDQMGLFGSLGGGAANMLGGGGLGGQYNPFAQQVVQQVPGIYNDAMASSGMIPHGAFNAFGNQMGGFGGMLAGGGAQAMGQAFGPGMNAGLSNQMFGQGFGMMQDNFRDVADNQLAMMREQAAPYEERAQNQLLQSLYNKGQMSSRGGERAVEAFGTGLGQADYSRMMGANQLGQSLYGMNQQFGQGMLGLGYQGSQQDISRQLGMGYLGQGMIGGAANLAGQGLQGAVQQSDLINSRAQQRLGQSMNMLFGGQQMQSQDLQSALAMLGGQSGLQQQLMNFIGTGSDIGAQRGEGAKAMMAQSSTNPFSGALEGLGGGLMGGGWSNIGGALGGWMGG